MPLLLDNKSQGKVLDALTEGIQRDSNISILSTLFSIYGFHALEKQLAHAKSLRLLIPFNDGVAATKEPLSFLINEILGDEADRRFRNRLNVTEISRRCEQWLRENAKIRMVSLPIFQNLFHIENPDRRAMAIHGSSPFTSSGLGVVPSKGYEMNTCFTAMPENVQSPHVAV
jgi:hypothetical protein